MTAVGRKLEWQIFRYFWLRQTLWYTAYWLFLWGITIIVLRVGNILPWYTLWYGCLCVVVPPIVGMILARRQQPRSEKILAAIDNHNVAGGLLMAGYEVDSESFDLWKSHLPSLTVPSVKWQKQRSVPVNVAALIFVAAALLLPDFAITTAAPPPLRIEDTIRRLQTQLDTLQEDSILTLEEVQTFKTELAKIQETAEGTSPNKTWDALDLLEDQITQKAGEAAAELQRNMELLSRAELLADETLSQLTEKEKQKDGDSSSSGLARELAKKMEDLFMEQPELAEKLAMSEDISEELKQKLQNGDLSNLTPEQLKELAEAMKKAGENCQRLLENMADNKLIDPEMLQQLRDLQDVAKEDMERLLAEFAEGFCEEGEDCEECEDCQEGRPCTHKRKWRRGPSDERSKHYADRDTDESGSRFDAKKLPPASLEALKNMQSIGNSTGAPEIMDSATVPSEGTVDISRGTGGGSAHSQTILPQHRGATKRYFGN